jgi:ubiquinone/menaquinone biosynthesis C-methylase UbiE
MGSLRAAAERQDVSPTAQEPRMSTDFKNVYDDSLRARAYAELDCPGTYYLAFRDLPTIIRTHVRGTDALDFGCGTGRSTRFLRNLGFDVVGLDISEPMLVEARLRDPQGDYRLVRDDDLRDLQANSFDLVLAAFTFDNIPTMDRKVTLFRALHRSLRPGGRVVTIVSAPEIYLHEWASFSTREFPENRLARTGDRVRIVMLDVEDRRPVDDILWTPDAYDEAHRRSGLATLETVSPLGLLSEPYRWVSETHTAPWTIRVLRADAG